MPLGFIIKNSESDKSLIKAFINLKKVLPENAFFEPSRAVGTLGRRKKDQEQRKQMVIGENSENVYQTLPKQKVLKNKQAQLLKEAVDSNRPWAKKH